MGSPHFSSGIVEQAQRLAFLAWDDFHTRSHFIHSTIHEEKWGLLVVYFYKA